MNYNELITSISNVGFPIVSCIVLFRLCNTTIKENTNAISALKDTISNKFGGSEK